MAIINPTKEADMKRAISTILALMLLVAVVPLFAGGSEETGKDVYRVGVIPKFIAEDYFIACENGFRTAEAELGNVKVDWVGDTMSQTSAANQKNYIQSFIDREYDAILVSALDPESYADTLREAREMGIVVITWDADVNVSARDFFINQVDFDEFAITILRGLADELKDDYSSSNKAPVALVSTTTDAPNQNAWIAAMVRDYKNNKDTKYSHLNVMVDSDQIVYAGNDQGTADEKIKSLLIANPDIAGVVALSSNTIPAVASARDQLGLTRDIAVTGGGVPETLRGDLEAGRMASVILWQPFDLGYLTLHVAVDILEGNTPSGDRHKSPLSGTSQAVSAVDGEPMTYAEQGHIIKSDNEMILGLPIVWNLRNIDHFRGYPEADHGMEYFLKK